MEILRPLTEGRYAAAETREDTMIPETPASPEPLSKPGLAPHSTGSELAWRLHGGHKRAADTGTVERLTPLNG